jgi:hypothetical protein
MSVECFRHGGDLGLLVDVGGSEAEEGAAAADVEPVVVGVGDPKGALVLGAVLVRVADEGALGLRRVSVTSGRREGGTDVVMEVVVRNGHKVGGVGQVNQAVVLVLVALPGGGQVAVVDPDVLGEVDGDGITPGGLDLADGHVTDDDVLLAEEGQADALEG